MQPAQLEAIRQSLDKVCRLVKPRRAALESFTSKLGKLLAKAQGQQNEAEVKAYLPALLPGICDAPDDQEPQGYSSPVCYAQVPGLREGFADDGLPAPPANRITGNTGLRENLQAALDNIRQLLAPIPGGPSAGAALERQAAALVYQLCELSPEEIAAFERP
jgi:hypothetical protein